MAAADGAPARNRPADPVGPPDHFLHRHHPPARFPEVVPRVPGLGTMITHHPQGPQGHDDPEGHRRGRVPRKQVRLVQRHAVHRDPAARVAADHVVTTHAHHPLHEVGVGGLRQPERRGRAVHQATDRVAVRALPYEGSRAVEDHQVPAARLITETVRQLVDQHPIPDPERRLHGAAGDQEGLDDEVAEQQQEDRADHAEHPGPAPGQLPPGGPPAVPGRAGPGERRTRPPLPLAGGRVTALRVRCFGVHRGRAYPAAPGHRWRPYLSRFSLIFAALPRSSRR